MKNENIWIIVIIAILAIFLLSGFWGMMPWGYGMMGSYWTGGWGFMWIFMILIWVLVIVALVLGIMWLAKQLQK